MSIDSNIRNVHNFVFIVNSWKIEASTESIVSDSIHEFVLLDLCVPKKNYSFQCEIILLLKIEFGVRQAFIRQCSLFCLFFIWRWQIYISTVDANAETEQKDEIKNQNKYILCVQTVSAAEKQLILRSLTLHDVYKRKYVNVESFFVTSITMCYNHLVSEWMSNKRTHTYAFVTKEKRNKHKDL